MKIKLIRVVNNKERYYQVELFTTLFGDFCVEREYGASKNKTATGKIKQYFNDLFIAQQYFNSILKTKVAKGYHK